MGKTNGYWKRHPRKDLQMLLIEFDEEKWRIKNPPTYYKVYCPCPTKHKTMVHLTPSDPNYKKNKQAWLHRQECYKGKHGGNRNALRQSN